MKFIVSHRPSWIVNVALRNPDFALHRLAKQYGVHYVIAGHIHQMLQLELEGVEVPLDAERRRASAGVGRVSGRLVFRVHGGWTGGAQFEIHELKAPHGQGRVTPLSDWGMLGLVKK